MFNYVLKNQFLQNYFSKNQLSLHKDLKNEFDICNVGIYPVWSIPCRGGETFGPKISGCFFYIKKKKKNKTYSPLTATVFANCFSSHHYVNPMRLDALNFTAICRKI